MDGDIPSFVWQHCLCNEWITYTDEENKKINNAIKKNKKVLTLSRNAVVIHFDQMIQKHKTSFMEEKIRPLIYNSGFISWMYYKNKNLFSYKASLMFLLEVAYQKKVEVFKYYDKCDYDIYLETFLEVNLNTKEILSVYRKQVYFPSLTGELFGICLDTSALTNMYEKASLNFNSRYIVISSSTMGRMMKTENVSQVKPLTGINTSDSANISFSVDSFCRNYENFEIFCENDKYFSATLSLVKLQQNVNKFFILQLLKSKKNLYKLYCRSGRIGNKGEIQVQCFRSNWKEAKKEFEKKFYEKTKNSFNEAFTYSQGHYNLVQVDSSDKPRPTLVKMEFDSSTSSIQSLLRMICNENTYKEALKELCYETSCVPLGDLTIQQIKKGYLVLQKIAVLISSGSSGVQILNTSDEFYSCIPHEFGRKCLPLIQTEKDIEDKMKILEALLNIRIALKAMYGEVLSSTPLVNPLTLFYERLNYRLIILDPTSAEFKAIEKSLMETCGPTHTTYRLSIVNILSCQHKHQDNSNEPNNYDDDNLLLWHGSRITNFTSILMGGLQIAPPEAPSTGTMFGKGLYFADIATKSANYCGASRNQNTGLLLMCEVNLGAMLHVFQCDKTLPVLLPREYRSVLGKGRIAPSNFNKSGILPAKAPYGPLVENRNLYTDLMYNEYVTYNEKNVNIRYLINLKFHFN